ncbi:hypothetical protein [Caldicellulosiruptor naganoensis]|uniref:DZANK-type domain-containing protein n=1 Tax=Caldicellulosiruptor naganoensis TaxID=29324 RepID=A0ABY7BCI6_9FIRM|nr:hypothetical protein [Caldicellulosiruptor naganoensis]WAM30548.1 hypothetical protein OTJ99_001300 [Caldicellulosiruptor naganoensis]
MGYKYCPRCELNRIPEEEELCPICKKDLEQLKKVTDENMKLCPYCHEEYIPEDQDMCESCFEERLLTGVVDDSEMEEETMKEHETEVFENDFVDIEPDILTELPAEEIDLGDAPLDFEELDVDEEVLLEDEEVKEEEEEEEHSESLKEEESTKKSKKEGKGEKKKSKKKK